MRSASTEQSAPEARARLSEKGRDRMWFTKALVAYDGSAASKNAVAIPRRMNSRTISKTVVIPHLTQ